MFAGSTSSTEKFITEFETICDKHKVSIVGRKDILQVFANNLPVPNNLLAKLSVPFYQRCQPVILRLLSFALRMLGTTKSNSALKRFLSFDVMWWQLFRGKRTILFGSKSSTHLSKIMNLPRNSPADPMHEIVLFNGKISKFPITLRKGQLMQRAEPLVTRVRVPFNTEQREKSLYDIQFWKRFDFKLILIILRLLFLTVFK